MPHWLTDACLKADTWLNVHAVWGSILGTAMSALVILVTLRVMASIVTKLVVRRVFGEAGQIQIPAESARQAAQAQANAAQEIADHQRVMIDEIGRTRAAMRADLQRILASLRNNTLPLTLVVETPEERQALEALISRQAPRTVVRQVGRTSRRDAEQVTDPAVPTAWARILTEDDEEGTPCPATTTIAPPPTPTEEPKPAKKAIKPRAPKSKKG
jgi:hypothetical protein